VLLEGIGQSHLQDGNPSQTIAPLREALAIYQRIGSPGARRVREPCINMGSSQFPLSPPTIRNWQQALRPPHSAPSRARRTTATAERQGLTLPALADAPKRSRKRRSCRQHPAAPNGDSRRRSAPGHPARPALRSLDVTRRHHLGCRPCPEDRHRSTTRSAGRRPGPAVQLTVCTTATMMAAAVAVTAVTFITNRTGRRQRRAT
jgi:hypothetical protein